MVVIRLSRGGSKKRPFYNIVVTDRQNRRDGRFLERLGYYNPMAAQNEREIAVHQERIAFWTGRGAQVSETVQRLLRQLARDPQRGAADGPVEAGAQTAQAGA